MSHHYAPMSVEADARDRAWRTFVQGLAIDVSGALLVALMVPMTDIRWTREYWIGVGLLAGKTVIHSAVSYLYRKLVAPGS